MSSILSHAADLDRAASESTSSIPVHPVHDPSPSVATKRQAITNWALSWLREEGYRCEIPLEWESPRRFCARLGISGKLLSKKLRAKACPPIDVSRGPSGRLLEIASNTDFEAFCKRP